MTMLDIGIYFDSKQFEYFWITYGYRVKNIDTSPTSDPSYSNVGKSFPDINTLACEAQSDLYSSNERQVSHTRRSNRRTLCFFLNRLLPAQKPRWPSGLSGNRNIETVDSIRASKWGWISSPGLCPNRPAHSRVKSASAKIKQRKLISK